MKVTLEGVGMEFDKNKFLMQITMAGTEKKDLNNREWEILLSNTSIGICYS